MNTEELIEKLIKEDKKYQTMLNKMEEAGFLSTGEQELNLTSIIAKLEGVKDEERDDWMKDYSNNLL